jgi:acyl carrier protein phosphodiesterase
MHEGSFQFPIEAKKAAMNWLAHVFLSEPTIDFRLGNLLADLVRGPDRVGMPPDFLRGAACHKAIDAFTDAHPIVIRSRRRLDARYRRFSGVLIDIFYDYFLAQSWDTYATRPLDEYSSAFYLDVRRRQLLLPSDAATTLARIVKHDLLGQYQRLSGVENSLRRISTYISRRWGRSFELEASITELQAHESDLAKDFEAFFPQLRMHVDAQTF